MIYDAHFWFSVAAIISNHTTTDEREKKWTQTTYSGDFAHFIIFWPGTFITLQCILYSF